MRNEYIKWQNLSLSPKDKERLFNLNEEEIKYNFSHKIRFGTAGLRGIDDIGINNINKYIVKSLICSFSVHLLNKDYKRGVCIAYDNRLNSKSYAYISARVLASYNIPVFLFSTLKPTPLLSYAVKTRNAIAGIVITASHNTKEYNGIKLYNELGQQYSNVTDISDYFQRHNDYDFELDSLNTYIERNLIHFLDNDIDNYYIEDLLNIMYLNYKSNNTSVSFTSLHGTSSVIIKSISKKLGINLFPILEQDNYDPAFSTVKSPNPEDFSNYELAISNAFNNNTDCIIAIDPDSDRIGIQVKHKEEYVPLSTNELATVLIHYLLTATDNTNKLFISSLYSSLLPELIAKSNNINTIRTPNGFKNILKHIDNSLLMAYEESCGFLFNTFVRDKDAFQAFTLSLDAIYHYKKQNRTFIDVLEDIYSEYGNHICNTHMFTFDIHKDKDILSIYEDIKQNKINISYSTYEDLLNTTYKENALKFSDNNYTLYIRPSGTENKLKIYINTYCSTMKETKLLHDEIFEKIKQLIYNISRGEEDV